MLTISCLIAYHICQACKDLHNNHKRGEPEIVETKQNGIYTTIILKHGGTRILYDLVPVVSFRGWPAVAMGWLTENHYWDGIVQEEEGIWMWHV